MMRVYVYTTDYTHAYIAHTVWRWIVILTVSCKHCMCVLCYVKDRTGFVQWLSDSWTHNNNNKKYFVCFPNISSAFELKIQENSGKMLLRLIVPLRLSYTIPSSFIHTSAANAKGHSKWQNIQHVKAECDAARANKIKEQMRRIRVAIAGRLRSLIITSPYKIVSYDSRHNFSFVYL